MAKRRAHKSEEILLIPFLDILCSLIGVLALIIVVLVVAQTQKINGRTPEEVQRAQEHLKLLKIQQQLETKYAGLDAKLETLAAAQKTLADRRVDVEKAKDLLLNGEAIAKKNQSDASRLEAQIERLKTEIKGLEEQEPTLKQKVAELLAAVARLQPPEKKEAKVQINPVGSGLGAETQVFVVDAAGDKLSFTWNAGEKYTVSSVPEVISTDAAFNEFLAAVKAVPQSRLIFFLREDGMRSYNLGAGWAQSNHGFKADQIGKVPVPGRGDLDLSLFGKFLGKLPGTPPARPNPSGPANPLPPPTPQKTPPAPMVPKVQ